jgi:hypothetical protein
MPISIETGWDAEAVERAVDEAILNGRTNVKKSHMRLQPYNGYSGELRVAVDRKIKVAIELGLIPPPLKCSVCGCTEGRIDYHNEDYSHALRTIAVCVRCHLALHNRLRSRGGAERWGRLVKLYGNGTQWFEQLATE